MFRNEEKEEKDIKKKKKIKHSTTSLQLILVVMCRWDPRSLLRTGSMPHLYHQNILSKLKGTPYHVLLMLTLMISCSISVSELVVKHEHVLKRSESQIDIQAALAASCLSEFDEHVCR